MKRGSRIRLIKKGIMIIFRTGIALGRVSEKIDRLRKKK